MVQQTVCRICQVQEVQGARALLGDEVQEVLLGDEAQGA